MSKLDAVTPDGVLIQELLGGSTEALRVLVERHQPSLVDYARGFLPEGEPIEAAVRRALRRGLSQVHRLRRNSLLSSFLIGVLRHELGRKGFKSARDDAGPLWSGLAGLPRVQREVVFLHFQGFSLRDVARLRHEPPSQTRSRFSNGIVHVAKKARSRVVEPELRPGCTSEEDTYLWLAGAVHADRASAFDVHAAQCDSCRNKRAAAAALFNALEGAIRPLAQAPTLLAEIPGPTLLPTLLGAGVLLALAVLAFFLIRSALGGAVKPAVELPAGEVRILEEAEE